MKSLIGRIALTVLCVFSLEVSASDFILTGGELQYQAGRGEAQVNSAAFVIDGVAHRFGASVFQVGLQNDVLSLSLPQENFQYDIAAAFLNGVQEVEATSLNLESTSGALRASLATGELVQGSSTTTLKNFSLSCQGSAQGIDMCLSNGRLTLGELISRGSKTTEVSEADLKFTNGNATFSIRIDGTGKINGNGSATHDVTNGQIKIHVSKVKLGILDITGRFFTEIGKINSSMITVQRPYIYIKL